MTNEELKDIIGKNIVRLRKAKGMTQADLAEKLNYSDKAISKWERGESMPDVLTLMNMAEIFDTNVNAILGGEPEPAEPEPAPVQPEPAPIIIHERRPKLSFPPVRAADRGKVQKLSSALVWVIVVTLYLILDSFDFQYSWMVFLLGILANAIVLLSLRAAWKIWGINRILVSIILWSALTFFYLLLLFATGVSVWRVFLMGLVGQMAIILWFKVFRHPKEAENEQERNA